MRPIIDLVVQSFTHPRETATAMIAQRYHAQTAWAGAFLVILLGGIVKYLIDVQTPIAVAPGTPEAEIILMLFGPPFYTTFLLGAGLIGSIYGVYWGGRMLGGTGTLSDTVIVMSWVQFISTAAALVELLIITLTPQLAGFTTLLSLVVLVMTLYVAVHFVDILHSYDSMGAAFGTIVLSSIGLTFGLLIAILLAGGDLPETGAL